MNSMKLFSAALIVVLLGLMTAPGSDATTLFHPLHIFTAAKLGTMALIKKGLIVGGIGAPLIAKKVILGKVALVGGAAGLKAGLLGSSIKAPLFLAKSALPNVLSLAPLLKGIGKKGKSTRTVAARTPAPMLPPPVPAAPVYTPAYAPPAAPAYAPPAAPAYAPPMVVRSGY